MNLATFSACTVHPAGLLAEVPDGGVPPATQDGQRVLPGAGVSTDHSSDLQHLRSAHDLGPAVHRGHGGRLVCHPRGKQQQHYNFCIKTHLFLLVLSWVKSANPQVTHL